MKEQPAEVLEPLETIARRKGHIPNPGPIRFRGDIHRGPHIDVVKIHSGLASNSLLTEAQYDKYVSEAYSLTLTERG